MSHCTDPSVASALHSVVEPYLLRRVKSEVVKDLPVKTEVILYTGLSGMQKKYYKAILTKDLSETFSTGWLIEPETDTLAIRLVVITTYTLHTAYHFASVNCSGYSRQQTVAFFV